MSDKPDANIMERTPRPQDGYDIIQQIIGRIEIQELLTRLGPFIPNYVNERVGRWQNPECGTFYSGNGSQSPESIFWALGLMSVEWILVDLQQKTRETHCNTHKRQTGGSCDKGREFHKRMYEACKKSFEDAIKQSNPTPSGVEKAEHTFGSSALAQKS